MFGWRNFLDGSVLLRIFIAFILGDIIGLEREVHIRPASLPIYIMSVKVQL